MAGQQHISAAVGEQFDQQVAFLQRMVRTRSTNRFTPDLSPPDVPVEEEIAAVFLDELRGLGFQASRSGVSPERPSVV